jgi:hypothetical protein
MRQAYIHKYAPMREIGEYMNREHPGAPILLAEGSDIAAFHSEVYVNGWHQYVNWDRMRHARTPVELSGILTGWNVHYVAAPKPRYGFAVQPRTLQDILDECATPEYQSTGFYLARIEEGCRQVDPAQRPPLPVQPGAYDDLDPAFVYEGPWIRDTGWAKAQLHTLTYTNLPGSKVTLAFEGGLLSYVYTRAANRGVADVAIDGVHRATVDLYSPKTLWQYRTIFKQDRGRHLAVITVMPEKNPKSSERWIDVDGFEVQ